MTLRALSIGMLGLALLPLAAVAGQPSFIKGEVACTYYDGVTDDLLTGGLGASGLLGAAPAAVDPTNPTAAELRRLAIYNNYRALVPVDPGGGYGTLFGPNIDADGNDTGGEGLVPGWECIAFARVGSGKSNHTLMAQVPDSFDPHDACMVTAASSGSRGVYGAIGTSAEWGLRRGCAVAYTDKGTGTGAHNMATNSVSLITGERVDAEEAGKASHFTAKVNEKKRQAFDAATPNRFAYKHAHSQRNPEAHWGLSVLRAIQFTFAQINALCDDGELDCAGKVKPKTTIVIASSVSNGGGAAVRAAEQDKAGWIDGVAVSEPNVNPAPGGAFAIQQGSGAPFFGHSLSLYDYTTVLHLYQGCANLAPENALAPFNTGGSALRCQALADKGLLSGATLDDQATEAQAIIQSYGFLPEQNVTQPSNYGISAVQGVAVTYANAYARASVLDNLCGYSFGATDGAGTPIALDAAAEAGLFGTSNGIPPSAGVNIINHDSLGGPRLDAQSISPSSGLADLNLDGSLCLRGLATGRDPVTGAKLKGRDKAAARRIARSISRVRASGDLGGRPAIFVTGRADAILPPNHSSRPYFGLNKLVEGEASHLRYYEVLNAHHLDALTILDVLFNTPLFSDKFIPLHHYLFQGLDLMYDHLKHGTPLPPSQVVRTVPRGVIPPFTLADVPPLIEAVNLPAISQMPPAGDLILFEDATVKIPD
ncbi:MAG: 3-hydroxybutyrate oligomer hydrolase family protein [Pseudomonadota bacterium]